MSGPRERAPLITFFSSATLGEKERMKEEKEEEKEEEVGRGHRKDPENNVG